MAKRGARAPRATLSRQKKGFECCVIQMFFGEAPKTAGAAPALLDREDLSRPALLLTEISQY